MTQPTLPSVTGSKTYRQHLCLLLLHAHTLLTQMQTRFACAPPSDSGCADLQWTGRRRPGMLHPCCPEAAHHLAAEAAVRGAA